MKIKIVSGSITQQDVDAIVNAANRQLRGGSGVCGAIFQAAGWDQMQAACWDEYHPPLNAEGDRIHTGQAMFTNCYDLYTDEFRIKFVVHAVGPVYDPTRPKEMEYLLRSAYWSALTCAIGHGAKTVAFPAISAGVYGYPLAEAARIAIDAVATYRWKDGLREDAVDKRLDEVRFVLFDPAVFDAFTKAFRAHENPDQSPGGIVDRWLEATASRWEQALTVKPPDFERLGDMPPVPGNVTSQMLIDEVRSRRVRVGSLQRFLAGATHTDVCEYRNGFYDESARCDCGLVEARRSMGH